VCCLFVDREFLKKEYADVKALNPTLPFYIRPAHNVEPFVAVRYNRGIYEKHYVSDQSSGQISLTLKSLAEKAPEINAKSSLKDDSGGGIIPKIAYII